MQNGSFNCTLEMVSGNYRLLDKELTDDNKFEFIFDNEISAESNFKYLFVNKFEEISQNDFLK